MRCALSFWLSRSRRRLSASAQLLAAKDGPIVYGHHHLVRLQRADHKKFWVDTLGGVAVTIGTKNREIVKFPNALLFMNPGMPTGGRQGKHGQPHRLLRAQPSPGRR